MYSHYLIAKGCESLFHGGLLEPLGSSRAKTTLIADDHFDMGHLSWLLIQNAAFELRAGAGDHLDVWTATEKKRPEDGASIRRSCV